MRELWKMAPRAWDRQDKVGGDGADVSPLGSLRGDALVGDRLARGTISSDLHAVGF